MELGSIITDFKFCIVQLSAADILLRWFGVMYCIFKVAEHLAQESFFGNVRISYRLAASGDHRFGLFDGFMFAQVFFMHHKVDHVQAFAVGFAAGGKAVAGLRFIVHLHTGGFIIMERAMQPLVLIGLQAVIIQYMGQGELLFDLGDFHLTGV